MLLESVVEEAAEALRPAENLLISQAAEKYRHLNNPGAYVGPWRNDKVPYLVEPMDMLLSREVTGLIFVGPAQSGKTDILFNSVVHAAVCSPRDIMMVHMSQWAARNFSISKFNRFNRYTEAAGSRLLTSSRQDNTFDKAYLNGTLVTLSWPSISELSSKTLPFVWLTDYDRMPLDIESEGSPFDLARKRTTSFGNFGMTVAESSPGHLAQVDLAQWAPHRDRPHEAPPAAGIAALYNRGDRRRWYWTCVECNALFEPRFGLMVWPESDDPMESAEQAGIQCPHCKIVYSATPRPHNGRMLPGKVGLNQAGKWCRETTPSGTPLRSRIASYWLFGPAAAFQPWSGLVLNYLQAKREQSETGGVEALKTTVTVDQGEVFSAAEMMSERGVDELRDRQRSYNMGEVPDGVRFLVCAIDLQKNSFEVQVEGITDTSTSCVIDRFQIRKSEREDADGDRYWVRPFTEADDWRLLIDAVIRRRYPLADASGREMEIRLTVCDTGGEGSATTNAYTFWRHIRDEHSDLRTRFLLLKGATSSTAPRAKIAYPDSSRRDIKAAARGEIPVLMLNTQMLKDIVNGRLDREDGVVFPSDYPKKAYEELTVEVRDEKGRWVNPKRRRNESWDLLVYTRGAVLSKFIDLERVDWARPPAWAEEWDRNSLVVAPGASVAVEVPVVSTDRLQSLGAQLA